MTRAPKPSKPKLKVVQRMWAVKGPDDFWRYTGGKVVLREFRKHLPVAENLKAARVRVTVEEE